MSSTAVPLAALETSAVMVIVPAAHVAEELHGIAVDMWFDPFAKVRLVVRYAGHLQTYAGALGDLDRALPSGPTADLAAVHRVVAQLRRRLATRGSELRGQRRHDHIDMRRTMRGSLQTGGVPVVIKQRPRRPR